MSDAEGKPIEGVPIEGVVAAGASGDQSFAYAGQEIEVEDAAHRRRVQQQQLDHDLTEERKDRDLRRKCFWLVVILLVAILSVSAVVGIGNDDEETRRWAQNVVTTMIGGLLGAVAGYLTARVGK
jgi:hypothetical protein